MIPKPGILKWFKFTQNHIAKPQEFIEASNLYNEVENELGFKLHAYPFVRGKLVNEKSIRFQVNLCAIFFSMVFYTSCNRIVYCVQATHCFIHNQIKIEYICQFWGVVLLGMLSYCVQGRVDMVVGYEEG